MANRRRSNRIWFVMLGVFVAVFLFTFLAQKFKNDNEVGAANMAAFDPGYIISDYQMSNYNSMNEAQIQSFLSSKGRCGNTNFSGVGTRVGYFSDSTPPTTWHVVNGHTVCLAEENMNGESAAHIIWQAAQDYRINPQVLIVLLQKETGLITDPIPNSWDYQRATGYGCPDTAACSSKYYGFKNQVRNAAWLFRYTLDNGYSRYPIGNVYVQWNPNAGCGGSIVNIKNNATAALYRYTPYQPNAAALASSYGYGDGCSAYGNRNFYSYFEDWFGNIKWDGWPSVSVVLSNNRIAKEESDANIEYQAHIEHYGWLGWVGGGEMAGTSGYSARMEAVKINLKEGDEIEYRSHVQDIGWMDYVQNNELSGTTGQSKQIEAIQIRLKDDMAKRFDVYYRVHVQGIGWMDWVKNDEIAGTTGQSRRIESVQIKITLKQMGLGPEYSVHVQDYGWMGQVKDGELAGTTGQSKRVEAVKIKLPEKISNQGSISYSVHVQDYGWMGQVKDGELAGTTGQSKRVEAVKIKLEDELAEKYDIYYRVHIQDYGWMNWASNGDLAGTTGQSKRIEALRIELVEK